MANICEKENAQCSAIMNSTVSKLSEEQYYAAF